MSELKTFRFLGIDEIWTDSDMGNIYYLKSEADEVISELEESHKKEVGQLLMEIAELKETLKNSRNAHKYWRKEYLIEYKECLHNKYKRCLEMAEKCDYKSTIYRMMINVESSKIDSCPYFIKLYSKKKERFEKWHKRWLAIAEKFKEAK